MIPALMLQTFEPRSFLLRIARPVTGLVTTKGEIMSAYFLRHGRRILTLSWFLGASGAFAATPFVPQNFVPISAYVETKAAQEVRLAVRPEVLRYAKKNGILIASCATPGPEAPCTSNIVLNRPHSVDFKNGAVISTILTPGTHVAVFKKIENQFPVVTHWNQALHSGRGGQQIGGKDRLGSVVYNPDTQAVSVDSQIFNPDLKSDLNYDVKKFRLFGSDPIKPEAEVPSYERYIGEDYSIFSLDERTALTISNQVVEATGFPVVHINGGTEDLVKKIVPGLPAFQVVHAQVVAISPDKPSLVTYIVPPLWSPSSAQKYPVLFYGYYDIHETFARYAYGAMKMTGSLMKDHLGSAITVLWNGGGSYGPIALQQSAYDNAALVFDEAKLKLNADIQSVVTVGCSRGGVTALAVAANPRHSNYRVKYALAYSPSAYKIGERTRVSRTWTFPGYLSVLGRFSGYRFAWTAGWKDPDDHTGSEVSLFNYTGSYDFEVADREHSHGALSHLAAFQRKGTHVILHSGTHDSYNGVYQPVNFVSQAAAAHVPIQFHLAYRFGHCGIKDVTTAPELYLRKILTQDETFQSKFIQYRRVSDDNWSVAEEFSPATPPVVVEMPLELPMKSQFLGVLAAGVGTKYSLKIWKMNESLWQAEQKIERPGEPVATFNGVVPANEHDSRLHGLGSVLIRDNWQSQVTPGLYTYELTYQATGETSTRSALWTPNTAPVNRHPIIKVVEREEKTDLLKRLSDLASEQRGNGLSSY